jgi:hypothetical protein
MRKLIVTVTLVILSTVSGLGQKNVSTDVNGKAGSNSSATVREQNVLSTTNIDAQLTGTIDAKRSQVGDEVMLKTTKSIKQDGSMVIPKGTRLIGRITEVEQRTKQNPTSKIGLIFDRIEGRDLSAPITATIVSVTNIAASSSVGDTFAGDLSGTSSTASQTSTGGKGTGGGLLAGAASTVGRVGSTVGGVLNTTTQTAGGVVGTAGQTLGTTAGTLGRTVNGLQISQSASGSASGSTTLLSNSRNVKIEKGATFNLNVSGSAEKRAQ